MRALATIDEARLAEIETLLSGGHEPNSGQMCVMEAAAYIAREQWSDQPKCVCPVLGAFLRAWNDGLSDDKRTALLKPLLPRIINTRGSKVLEERRALMAADWLVRVHTPAWLRLAGLTVHADALSTLPEITSMGQVPSIRGPIDAARMDAAAAGDAAWAAAWDAARDAAWAAAWDAARDAAWAAARAAARAAAGDAAWAAAWAAARDAALAAAWDAAWDAARDAAWAAARDAARAKLAPVQTELQQSALALVERMIAAEDPAPALAA